ncbi:MAG TPA: LysR family transcriptional regulator [Candidatus Tenderia sp.]|nr:LysR family transcriptional regulator [Candidatus Tenderia sp.]
MRNATFRQLQVFESIARNGSFTAAAEELFLTQPTLSMQMKKLTSIVETPLYTQVGKKIYLTEVGEELQKTCRSVFATLDDFQMTVSDIKGVKKGNLRISGVTTGEYFVPRILGAFCKKYPGINVSLEVTNRQRVIERLESNMDDIYIVGQAPMGDHIHRVPFLKNPLVILAPPQHPLAKEKNIPIEALADENFIMREPGCGTFLSMDRLVKDRHFGFKSSMALGSNEAIKQAVIGGLGISLLSVYALTHEIASGEVAVLDVEGFPVQDCWYLCYPEGQKLSVVAQVFYEFMLNEGREMTVYSLPEQ